jgi:arginyl-tRNA synthetase
MFEFNKNQKNTFLSFLEENLTIWKKISRYYKIAWKNSFFKWDIPGEIEADFAITLAIPISYSLKKNPYDVALEIKDKFLFKSSLKIFITDQGYINCSFDERFYKNYLNYMMENGIERFQNKNLTINIEFVSVNPTGYIHLGHLRNGVIGDVLSNIYEFIGYKVIREYYINDRGNQIDELIESVLFYYLKDKNVNSQIDEQSLSYNNQSTKDASCHIKDIFPLEEITNKSEDVKKEILEFFINRIKSDLLLCGIKFNNWFSEKKMYDDEQFITKVIKNFSLRDLIYKKDRALFLKTSLAGDDKDRVIIKENGDYTYFFSDIIYHLNKLTRADLFINIWGSDHHGYVERLLSSLEFLGNKRDKFSIILIQMVSLLTNEGSKKFSKRLGTTIEISEALNIIDKDQLKFCLIEKESNHSFTINLETLSKEKKNSRLYYIQYAHARCNQILLNWEKFEKNNDSLFIENDVLLTEKKEKDILKYLICFSQVIFESAEEKKPFLIIHYLQNLSKKFQSYYQSHVILQKKNYDLSKQRVVLVKAVKNTIKKGLEICGISAPNFMKSDT